MTPAVTASVRFDPDYRRHEIGVHLTNVDRFETVHLDFKPERFDEGALEDLVRLLLGESNAFLRRAPLSGIGAGKKAAVIEEPVVYRVEKTLAHPLNALTGSRTPTAGAATAPPARSPRAARAITASH